MPVGDDWSAVEVVVEVFDVKGRRVAEAKGHLGGQVEVQLPDGLSLIRATVDDIERRMMDDEVGCFVGEGAAKVIGEVVGKARKLQKVGKYTEFAGMLDFLAQQIEDKRAKEKDADSATIDLAARLAYWVGRIENESNPLAGIEGRLEWAYPSKVDGTGRRLCVPVTNLRQVPLRPAKIR